MKIRKNYYQKHKINNLNYCLSKKKLSYNNLLDLDAAVTIAYETNSNKYICTIVKHNIPCGASIENTQIKSYESALAGDPISAFGGIVAFNKKVTNNTAKHLIKNFYEIIAAPNFDKEAINTLKNKKNLIFGSYSKKSSMSYPKAFDDLDIITCPECQFSFTNKPLSKKILDFYYKNLYTGKSIKSSAWNPYYQRSRFQYSERSLAQMSLLSQFFSWDKKNITN